MLFKKNPEANCLIHVTFTPLSFFFLFKSNFITIKTNASSCIVIFTQHFGTVNTKSDWHSAHQVVRLIGTVHRPDRHIQSQLLSPPDG